MKVMRKAHAEELLRILKDRGWVQVGCIEPAQEFQRWLTGKGIRSEVTQEKGLYFVREIKIINTHGWVNVGERVLIKLRDYEEPATVTELAWWGWRCRLDSGERLSFPWSWGGDESDPDKYHYIGKVAALVS